MLFAPPTFKLNGNSMETHFETDNYHCQGDFVCHSKTIDNVGDRDVNH